MDMNIDVLKAELEKIGYTNLFVNRGQNPDYVERIKHAFNPAPDMTVLGFIDANYSLEGNYGVLITEEGIRWNLTEVTIDEKKQDKGSLTFAELGNYSLSSRIKIIRNAVTLTKRDVSDGKNLHIEMAFLFDNDLDEQSKEEQTRALERVFAVLRSFSGSENAVIPDEKNNELIEAFIGDSNGFYQKAFSKYSVNGIEKFAFCFSWGGFIFGVLNLFHRKLYKEAAIWLIGGAVLSAVSSGILTIVLFFVGAFANPYLLYKRFKKILLQCDTQNRSYNQKLETLRMMGGTNMATSIVLAIMALITLIIFVVALFRACFT
jgi:hypothetical protein